MERPWGSWFELFRDAKIEFRVLNIHAGGFCSTHLHERKFNCFEVISGEILIEVYEQGHGDTKVVIERQTRLTAGDVGLGIAPGTIHRFRAVNGGAIVYETMRAVQGEVYDPDDTVTFLEAGKD